MAHVSIRGYEGNHASAYCINEQEILIYIKGGAYVSVKQFL